MERLRSRGAEGEANGLGRLGRAVVRLSGSDRNKSIAARGPGDGPPSKLLRNELLDIAKESRCENNKGEMTSRI